MIRGHAGLLALSLALVCGQALACQPGGGPNGECCKKKSALSKTDAAEVKYAVNSAFAIEHGKFDGKLTAADRQALELQTSDLRKAIAERKINPALAGKDLAEKVGESCEDKKACGDCCDHEHHSSLDGASKVIEGGCGAKGKKAG